MFKQIEVSNFKSLKYLDYKCCKLNILTGLNGSGKSSFIQALLCIKKLLSIGDSEGVFLLKDESRDFGTQRDIFYSYDNNSRILIGANMDISSIVNDDALLGWVMERGEDLDTILEVRRYDEDKYAGISHAFGHLKSSRMSVEEYKRLRDDAKKELSKLVAGQVGDVSETEKHKRVEELRESIRQFSHEINELSGGIPELSQIDFRSVPLTNEAHTIKYLSANRSAPHYEHALLSNVKWPDEFGDEGEGAVSYLLSKAAGQVKVAPVLSYPGTSDYGLLPQINSWMSVVSPGANLNLAKNSERTRALLDIDFEHGEDTAPRYRPQNVGFGISYTLPVLALILTAHRGDVLIIENPEAHLHPRGQAEIGKLLAKAAAYGVQIFVETHSDHVINGVRVAVKRNDISSDDVKIAFFERKPHEVKDETSSLKKEIFTTVKDILVDKNGSLSEYPEDFMDEWNNQLMELLK